MFRWLVCFFCLLSCSCAGSSGPTGGSSPLAKFEAGTLYLVPFETIMVPGEVSERLFDLFVDQLIRQGEKQGVEYVILKQGLAEIDPAWLAGRSYLRGEVFAYIEEIGSSMTNIKARSRIRLYQPRRPGPALEINFPAEIFYQNDYSSLPVERHKLAEEIARSLAGQLLAAISPP